MTNSRKNAATKGDLMERVAKAEAAVKESEELVRAHVSTAANTERELKGVEVELQRLEELDTLEMKDLLEKENTQRRARVLRSRLEVERANVKAAHAAFDTAKDAEAEARAAVLREKLLLDVQDLARFIREDLQPQLEARLKQHRVLVEEASRVDYIVRVARGEPHSSAGLTTLRTRSPWWNIDPSSPWSEIEGALLKLRPVGQMPTRPSVAETDADLQAFYKPGAVASDKPGA